MSEISFIFDDKIYKAHEGEPMAAALLRNGLLTITNSTYHGRPRGVIGLGVEEPNALVQLVSGTKESMRPATVIEVAEGLAARSLSRLRCALFRHLAFLILRRHGELRRASMDRLLTSRVSLSGYLGDCPIKSSNRPGQATTM